MVKLRTTAVLVTALLVTVSISVIASANISPQSLNTPSRNQGADLNKVGAQKPIFGADYISAGDDVCLPHIPNVPPRRDKVGLARWEDIQAELVRSLCDFSHF
jgi:hypothetical protein